MKRQRDKIPIVKALVKSAEIPALTVIPKATSTDIFLRYKLEANQKLLILIRNNIDPKLIFNK